MARSIQPQANQARGAGVRVFLGLLANAIFWLVVAIAFPVQILSQLVPGLARTVDWLPVVFYGLALLSFIRAVRSLRGLNVSALNVSAPRRRVTPDRPERPKKSDAGRAEPPVSRQPTVQRMR